jgi:hypothetical protein
MFIDQNTGLLVPAPAGSGGGGGTSGGGKFYECLEVGEGTWSGCEWVLVEGVYAKSAAVTPGLAWTSVKPKVGKSYSADALVTAVLYQGIMPVVNGLTVYIPLNDGTANTTTGQTATMKNSSGAVQGGFENDGAFSYWCPVARDYIEFDSPGITSTENGITFGFFVKSNDKTNDSGNGPFIFSSYPGGGYSLQIATYNGKLGVTRSFLWDDSPVSTRDVIDGVWHHCIVTIKGTSVSIYTDGTHDSDITVDSNAQYIGSPWSLGRSGYSAPNMAHFKVWNRVLSAEEITQEIAWAQTIL